MSAQPIESLRIERVPVERQSDRKLFSRSPEERANGLTFGLFRATLAAPEGLTDMAPDTLIALIPDGDPEVAALNLQAVRRAKHQGQAVKYVFLDKSGRAPGGAAYEYTIDLRDERWGEQQRRELGGKTAAELRQVFHDTVKQSQEQEPVSLSYENIVVLNGVRIYIVDEPAPGLYECVAFTPQPVR